MEVKVSGIVYTISERSPEEMNGNIGLANFNTQEIWINSSASPQTKMIARWHEIVHILERAYGVKMNEEQVTIFTHALVSFLNDNRDIVNKINNV
jgi:hypothetical protein